MSLVQELATRGLISQEQVTEIIRLASEKHNGNIEDALIEAGVDEDRLLTVKGEYFSLPTTTLDDKGIDPEVLKLFPKETMEHYQMIPISIQDGIMNVGVVDPDNNETTDALQFISSKNGLAFKIFLIRKKDFDKVTKQYQGFSSEVSKALSDFDTEDASLAGSEFRDVSSDIVDINAPNQSITGKKEEGKDGNIVEDAPVIKIVAVMLRHATEGNASDIHIENTGAEVKVRFRVDGILHTSLKLPLNVFSGVVARVKILAKLRLDEKRRPQDGGFSVKINNRKVDFRVSTFPAYYGEKVVLRILDQERGVRSLEDLDLRPDHFEIIKKALDLPYGLVIISGPTGSGKSTTLYAMLNALDREGRNVVSLEEPVEYQIEGVTQSQVRPEIGYTFANGLRSVLRQDPDVIMVGEIRDAETAQLAIQAALTGHLVISTLHTNSSIGIVPRLVDMGIDPYLIAPTLRLAIAQRLAQKTCDDARQEVSMDEATRTMVMEQFKDFPQDKKAALGITSKIIQTVASPTCPGGTRGRMAIFEMFEITDEIERLILESPNEQDLYKALRVKGMITMKEDALLKSLQGQIPFREVHNF
jgi:type IV pilus assembly protein PilB